MGLIVPFSLRHLEQRRIELHERLLHGRVCRVTRVARGRRRLRRRGVDGLRRRAELEVLPPARVREPLAVLHRGLERHDLGLREAAVVDRGVGHRPAQLQDEHRAVGPAAGVHERPVGLRVHEHVVEERRPPGCRLRRPVGHAQPARQVHPLAIVRRAHRLPRRRVGHAVGDAATRGRHGCALRRCQAGGRRHDRQRRPRESSLHSRNSLEGNHIMPQMRVAIDARKLHDFGIGTYIRNLLRHLARIDADDRVRAAVRRGRHATCRRRWAPTSGPCSSPRRTTRSASSGTCRGCCGASSPTCTTRRTTCCRAAVTSPSVVTIHDCIHLMFPQYLPNRRGVSLRALGDVGRRTARRRHPDRVGGVQARHPALLRREAGEGRGRPQRHRRAVLDAAGRRGRGARARALSAGARLRAVCRQHQAAQEPGAADRGLRRDPPRRLRGAEAADHRRRDLEAARRCAGPCTSTISTSTCGSWATCPTRRWRSCTGWRRCSCSRRSTKASACRRSRPWPAARRW